MVGTRDGIDVMEAKRGRPKKLTGEGSQVGIAPEVASMARLIVGNRGIELTDYLSTLLRPLVRSDYGDMVKQLDAAKAKSKGGAR